MGHSIVIFCCYVAAVISGLVCCVFRDLLPSHDESDIKVKGTKATHQDATLQYYLYSDTSRQTGSLARPL
jgi:hypothetical protein